VTAPDTATADAVLLWTENELRDDARRGHAYLYLRSDALACWTYQHAEGRTPAMVERLNAWQARHPPTAEQKLRRRVWWKEPGGPHGFHADLGLVQRMLEGRRFELHAADGEPPPAFPEAFLRAPVRTCIEAALPGVRWPAEWNADQLRFAYGSPATAREGEDAVVCAARYGSEYTRSGQDRTAAVFLSTDGGQSFEELPWTQHQVPRGQSCWPPETVRPRFENGRLILRWEDPWADWEPGYEWEGTWDPKARRWSVIATG